MKTMPFILCGLMFALPTVAPAADPQVVSLTTTPSHVRLHGLTDRSLLLVDGTSEPTRAATGPETDGSRRDLTREARFVSLTPAVVEVSERGVVWPVADGTGRLRVSAAGLSVDVPVAVSGTRIPRRFNFENDILPLFGRHGCNASGCHGKAEGQNGFKLSVFGFDPPADFAALTKEARGRRVFLEAPERSLVITKMSGGVAHGGGLRIPRGSPDYETMRGWVAAGTPVGSPDDPHVVGIRVEPRDRQLAMKTRQQLRVVARFSDGREADVTHHARFQSNNETLAAVDENGLVTVSDVPGDVAVMASYANRVDLFRAIVPRPEAGGGADRPTPTAPPANNFIDDLVFRKLRRLNIVPSGTADDAAYLRRVYIDVIGTLPTPEEARRFLADTRPDRRARLVDDLLTRPEYADLWALRWADLLRVDRQALGHKKAHALYAWIRRSIADGKPLDEFARDILTAEGPLDEVPAAGYFLAVTKPGEVASNLSQVFLGVRIACAECHHHPFDRWSQTDYYGMQAFFTQVGVKKSGATEMVMTAGDPQTRHPRTGEPIAAHPLSATDAEAPAATAPGGAPVSDRRLRLARWMTAPDNPFFARNLANRVWAHFLGRGIVEPVDDVRDTNPPTNPELLDALARHLVEHRFDVRQLIRAVTASRVYQLSSVPNPTNDRDEQNYSRAAFRRIDAEVLLDMVSQTTGVPEKFPGIPAGTRAIQLWDSAVPHYFLKLYGRPVRVTACSCERNAEPNVSQVLHLLNSPEMNAKLTHTAGAVARAAGSVGDDDRLVEDLYLRFYSRRPSAAERALAADHLKKNAARRRQAAEDIAWSLMNSLEFVFNH